MATATEDKTPTGPEDTRHDGRRIFVIWLVLSAIASPLIYFVWGPHIPPNGLSDQASGQQFDNKVLGTVAAPVVILVVTFLIYSVLYWRQPVDAEEIVDGPHASGNNRLSAAWITLTSFVVLSLFVFGTYELLNNNGAGSGSGPDPAFQPGGHPLVVQVIAQQWRFTYRYPSFGGMETTTLVIPQGQEIAFNVTSLDVIHSFWAYKLGVKADANPGVDNVAYVKATKVGAFDVRCAELCGLWHGAMYSPGQVMAAGDFESWATQTEAQLAPVTALLPKYAPVYSPDDNGAGGTYYGPQYPTQP